MAFGSLQGIIGRAGGNEVIGRGIIDVGVSSYRIRHDMRSVTNAINGEAKLWGQAFRVASLGLAAMTAGATAAIVGGLAAAEKFNAAMAKIAAMTGVTTEQLGQMRQGILSLAQSLPQGPEALAKGLYFIASAGFRGVDALKLLDQAAKAAAASGSDLEVSADALVSVMNAYGLGADKAAYASDILTKTVIFGKVEFEDLARAIGPVATISRVAGISMEEMGSALSMLTSRGLSARRATNSLMATLRSLAKPTQQQWSMMKALGIDFRPEDLNTKGLEAVLTTFDEAVKKWQAKTTGQKVVNTRIYNKDGTLNLDASEKAFEKMNRGYFDQMGKLVGQSNAFLVSQILLQKTGETFDFYMGKMKDFTVSTNNAYKTAEKLDFGIIFGKMTSKIQTALIALGEKFLPALGQAIDWLGENAPKAIAFFSNALTSYIVPAAKAAWEGISKLLGALGDIFTFGGKGSGKSPLESFFMLFIDLLTTTLKLVGSVSTTIAGMLTNPVIKGIAQIAAGFMAIGLAFSFIKTASAGLASRMAGILSTMTFGKFKPGAAGSSAVNPLIGPQVAAANTLTKAGLTLTDAAYALMRAAELMMSGGAANAGAPFWIRGPGGRFARGGVLPGGMPIPSFATPAPVNGPMMGPFLPTASIVGGIKPALTGIKGFLAKGLGLVSKVFWPLLVTDIVGNIIKDPLGDIIGGFKGFENAGKRMKEDFWGGLIAVASTIIGNGPDMYEAIADHATVGGITVSKFRFKSIGIDAATVESAFADNTTDENGNPLTIKQAIPKFQADVELFKQEAYRRQQLLNNVLSTSLPNVPKPGTTDLYKSFDEIVANAKEAGIDVTGLITQGVTGSGKGATRTTKYDIAGIQNLARTLAKDSALNIKQAQDQLIEYMLQYTTEVGNTSFNRVDLISLGSDRLTQLASMFQEDVNGVYADFRAWKTNVEIAASKGVPKTAADFGNLPTLIQRAMAAFSANTADIPDRLKAVGEEVGRLQASMPNMFGTLTDFLTLYADKVKTAAGHTEQYLPIINEVFADQLGGKKFTSKTDKKGVITYFLGGKALPDDGDIQQFWQKLNEMITTAQKGTGMDLELELQSQIRQQVLGGVSSGLTTGLSFDQIKRNMDPNMWSAFFENLPGGDSASQVIATQVSSIIQKGIEAGKTTGFDPGESTAITKYLNGLFSTDAPLTWEDIKKRFFKDGKLDTAALQTWIEEQLTQINIPQALRDALDPEKAYMDRARGKKHPTGPKAPARDNWFLDSLGITPGKMLPEDTISEFRKSSEKIPAAVAEGMKNNKTDIPNAMRDVLSPLHAMLPGSPVREGPLADPYLSNSGLKIVQMLGSGVALGVTALSSSMNAMLSRALGKGSPAQLAAYFSGYNLGMQIANGILASIKLMEPAINALATRFAGLMPHNSPAKTGPFASWAWDVPYIAGQKLVGQITAGMSANPLSLPGIQASGSISRGSQGMGKTQQIYADKLQVLGPADKQSLLARLAFLNNT